MIIGSPPCIPSSQLQALDPITAKSQRQFGEEVKHMESAAALYHRQVEEGRASIHEQPKTAKSWGLELIRRVMNKACSTVPGRPVHVCLKAHRGKAVSAKKPTAYMTNTRAIGKELSRKCNGEHRHQHLIGGRAKDAARYPPELCRPICRGVLQEKRERATGVRAVAEIPSGYRPSRVDLEEVQERAEFNIPSPSLARLTSGRDTVLPLSRLSVSRDMMGTYLKH